MRVAPLRVPGVAGAAVVLGALLAPTPALAAADGGDGRWYYDIPRLAEVHQQTTGSGITIGLIDGRINTAVPDLVGADIQVHEPSYCAAVEGGDASPAVTTDRDARHATSIASLLVGTDAGLAGEPGVPGVAPGVSLRVYAVGMGEGEPCETAAGLPDPAGADATRDQAVRDAISDEVDILVVPGDRRISAAVVAEAQRADIIVIGAAGNHTGIVTGTPATYNGVVSTGTVDAAAQIDLGSPSGPRLGVVAPGTDLRSISDAWDYYGTSTGSSNSAAYTAGALALAWSAYPDARANQILQALVHTAGGTVVETPVHDDDWGYGLVNARTLVSVDPTAYPDENPFLSDDPTLQPAAADVLGGDEPADPQAQASTPTESVDEPVVQEREAGLPVLALAGGALLVATGVATAVVAARRRRATEPGPPAQDT
jgi:hypothetical protein